MNDNFFMKKALDLAKCAEAIGEVPVGAVIVKDGKIISRGFNTRESKKDGTAHAELIAIQKACKKLSSWRLTGCTLYVTLEPCIMCAGAIVNSRVERVVIGAKDPKSGAFGGIVDVRTLSVNHFPETEFGIEQQACSDILKGFFKKLRERKRN